MILIFLRMQGAVIAAVLVYSGIGKLHKLLNRGYRDQVVDRVAVFSIFPTLQRSRPAILIWSATAVFEVICGIVIFAEVKPSFVAAFLVALFTGYLLYQITALRMSPSKTCGCSSNLDSTISIFGIARISLLLGATFSYCMTINPLVSIYRPFLDRPWLIIGFVVECIFFVVEVGLFWQLANWFARAVSIFRCRVWLATGGWAGALDLVVNSIAWRRCQEIVGSPLIITDRWSMNQIILFSARSSNLAGGSHRSLTAVFAVSPMLWSDYVRVAIFSGDEDGTNVNPTLEFVTDSLSLTAEV